MLKRKSACEQKESLVLIDYDQNRVSVCVFGCVWVCVLVTQSCPTLCDPMGCSPSRSSVHGIFQARILEWVAISFSRGSSWPQDRTQVSCIRGRLFTIWPMRETLIFIASIKNLLISSVQFSRSVVSDSLQPHEPQHATLPCPSLTPGVHPNPCPLCRWCHPTISSSVIPFSSCLQPFPASGSFPMR